MYGAIFIPHGVEKFVERWYNINKLLINICSGDKVIRYIKANKQVLYFVLLAAFAGFYFLSEHLFSLQYHSVWVPLDDKIPFTPAFVIPYILWYPYIPAGLLAVYLTDRKAMTRQAWILFSGMTVCLLCFVLFPTRIDFRGDASGRDIFSMLCRIIYGSEDSVNVFPSMHCYEATAIHLSTFVSGPLKNKVGLRIGSAVLTVLICMSTVFVKQHSVVDIVAGCSLAFLSFAAVNIIYRLRGVKK